MCRASGCLASERATVAGPCDGARLLMHDYVSSTDCAIVPEGEVWMPPCHCGNAGCPAYRLGLHSTWDFPLCYIQKYGWCPCFLLSWQRGPSQWLAGDTLTRAAKDDWLLLIGQQNLQLPR